MKRYFGLFLFAISTFTDSFSQNNIPKDSVETKTLKEVVVTASKQEESLLKAPVSIEKMNLQDIKQSPQQSLFDPIQN